MGEVLRRRARRRRLVVFLVVFVATVLSVGMVCGLRYGYRKMHEKWLKSDSGQVYTPGGAAKKVIQKLKE